MKANGSEHAFPHMRICDGRVDLEGGLTKREVFAAMAMQGIICMNSDIKIRKDFFDESKKQGKRPEQLMAAVAIESADALIAELNKGSENE